MEGSRARFGRSVSLRPVLTVGDPRRGRRRCRLGIGLVVRGPSACGSGSDLRAEGRLLLLALVALAAALLALLAQVGGEVLGQAFLGDLLEQPENLALPLQTRCPTSSPGSW